jgi:CRISPR-associated protein Cmr1
MNFECVPLTPLWTGDANTDAGKRGGQIRETGLRGSLRSWYETLLRGCELSACDPSGGSCIYTSDMGLASICHACQMFGCTGYSSRVRIEVEGGSGVGDLKELRLSNPGTSNHRGWRIPPRCNSNFRIKIVPLFAGADMPGLAIALHLIERYGALGAKTSHGQGAVRFENLPVTSAVNWQAQIAERPAKSGTNSPRLSDFIGATVRLRNMPQSLPLLKDDLRSFNTSAQAPWLPTSPLVRAELREYLRQGVHENDRHRLMGTIGRWGDPNPDVKDGRRRDRAKGSAVHVTHTYRTPTGWETRIFAFVPDTNNVGDTAIRALLSDRNRLAQMVRKALNINADSPIHVDPYPVSAEELLKSLEAA